MSYSKYHATRITTLDGQSFASKKEYHRWLDLCLLEQSGVISGLQRQVKFKLSDPVRGPAPKGKKKGPVIIRATYYVADFVYYKNGQQIVEDTKGVRTSTFVVKKAWMYQKYGIIILET